MENFPKERTTWMRHLLDLFVQNPLSWAKILDES